MTTYQVTFTINPDITDGEIKYFEEFIEDSLEILDPKNIKIERVENVKS